MTHCTACKRNDRGLVHIWPENLLPENLLPEMRQNGKNRVPLCLDCTGKYNRPLPEIMREWRKKNGGPNPCTS